MISRPIVKIKTTWKPLIKIERILIFGTDEYLPLGSSDLLLMFTQYKALVPLKVERYCMILHEHKKGQDVKCMGFVGKTTVNFKLEEVKIVMTDKTSC